MTKSSPSSQSPKVGGGKFAAKSINVSLTGDPGQLSTPAVEALDRLRKLTEAVRSLNRDLKQSQEQLRTSLSGKAPAENTED